MTAARKDPDPGEGLARVAFEIPLDLRHRAEEVIRLLRSDSDPQRHIPALVEVVLDMTDRGLHYYFLHPLEQAGVGIMTRKAVNLAIGTAGRTLPVVVRKTVGSLTDDQVLSIADFIDHILVEEEGETNP